ncbi:MAG: sodium transporter, partial [Proteobacteria bacterium]
MTLLDAAIVLAFAAWAIGSGLHARRAASRGMEDYFLAGRTLRGWQAGMSMAATQFAADTPLLVTGLIATAGLFSLWRLWIYALAFLLLGFVLAAAWRRSGALTDAELAELRYGSRSAPALRAVKAIYFGTIFNCTVLAMVLFATREIAEPLLRWNEWLPAGAFAAAESAVRAIGVPLARETGAGDPWLRSTNNALSMAAVLGVTAFYSVAGGLRSVVRTDVVQLTVMLAATALYALYVLDAVGGLGALPGRVADTAAALHTTSERILSVTPSRANVDSAAVLGVLGLQWLLQMNADGTGYLAQRAMACRSDHDARVAALVFTVTQVLLRSLLWIPIGLGLLVLFPPDPSLAGAALAVDREATWVRGMQELLPPGALGLLLAGMLAALASTLDTHLNWGASYWTHDLYARFVCRWLGRTPSQRELVFVARVSTFGVLLLALAIMTRLSSIQTAWHASLLLGAGMGVVLVLRWLWWRLTAAGELMTIATSSVLAPLLLLWMPDREALRLLVVAGAATCAGVATSLATGPEPLDRLVAFYRRVRPPGFWGPVARAAGADPARDAARLRRGLLATG